MAGLFSFLIGALFILIGIGELYWLWTAFQLGSFMMFVVGLFPLFIIVTGPVGAWSIFFGVPTWVVGMFG